MHKIPFLFKNDFTNQIYFRSLWTSRSSLERGLIIISVCGIITAISLGIKLSKVKNCARKGKAKI